MTVHRESVSRRPLIHEGNDLHLTRLNGWRWTSDIFDGILMELNLTGLFVLRGTCRMVQRGKWLVIAGMRPPLLTLLLFDLGEG